MLGIIELAALLLLAVLFSSLVIYGANQKIVTPEVIQLNK